MLSKNKVSCSNKKSSNTSQNKCFFTLKYSGATKKWSKR